MSLNFAHHMFMHTSFPFFSFLCYLVVMCSLSLSLSLSLSQINCAMAPKARKSTPTRNPPGSGSSSFDPIPPFHVWFRDEKARKDFLENFQKHGVHPECHVIQLDFADTPFSSIIWTRGWESLLESPLRCPIVFI